MLDDKVYQDRPSFDISTLIEGEVQALADSRAGGVSRAPLRRIAAAPDRAEAQQAREDIATMVASTAETGAVQTQPAPDYVNHPPHYTAHPSGVECITITEWMNFNLGNAVKYIWRSADKGATIEDLRKARWYLDREIDRLGRL